MIKNLHEVTMESIVGEVTKMKNDGQRFVTMSCTEIDADSVDILYHFDKNEELTNLRMTAPKVGKIPSVSGVFFCALLVENEMQDQFGLEFEGLVLDFGRTLLLDEEITTIPLCNNTKAMTKNK